MTVNRHLIFIVAACVCFVVALLLAVGAFHGSNESAWGYGGLLSLALSFLL
jgi:hypothetical protein